MDVTEDHRVFHASTVYFNGSKNPSRRTASIGPGVSYSNFRNLVDFDEDLGGYSEEDLEEQEQDHPQAVDLPSGGANGTNRDPNQNPGVEARPGDFSDSSLVYPNATLAPQESVHREDTTSSSSTGRSHYSFPDLDSRRHARRRLSVDASHFQPMPISETRHEIAGADRFTQADLEELAPIPPYTEFPVPAIELVGTPDTPSSPSGPAQSLEEFRNSLHSNLRNSQVFLSESKSRALLPLFIIAAFGVALNIFMC